MKFLKFAALAAFIATTASCGNFEWFPMDESPNSLSFSEKKDVEISSEVTSDSATVTGIDVSAPISVQNGEYSINNGPFTSQGGKIKRDQSVRVRHITADDYETSTTTYLTVGDVTASFKSTTAVGDVTPDEFAFVSPDVPVPFGLYSSNEVIITGLTGKARAKFEGYGYYTVNGERNESIVRDGYVVKIFQNVTSVGTKTGTLSIGGVSGSYTTTGAAEESAASKR